MAPGLGLAALMFLGAGYAHVMLVLLPRRLRRSLEVVLSSIDGLMRQGGG